MTYDLIVIGGGMSGISVGHYFRHQNIVILEKRELLAEASGKNAGFVIAGFGEHFVRTVKRLGIERATEIQELHRSSHRRIRELSTKLDAYQQTGSYAVAFDVVEQKELEFSCSLLQHQGYPVKWIEQPNVGLKKPSQGALFNPDDGVLDSNAFWCGIAADLPIETSCAVESVSNEANAIRVKTTRGNFIGRSVVFCLNAFADALVSEVRGKHILLRGQMLELPLIREPPTRGPIFAQHGDVYWRFSENTLLFGGLEHLSTKDEQGIAQDVSEDILHIQLEWIQQHFDPRLIGATPKPLRAWCSTMSYTVDGFPFVGALSQKKRYILGGLCGMGNSYALESGNWLYELIANHRNVIPSYCSSDRMNTLPAYTGGDWRKLHEAWDHGIH